MDENLSVPKDQWPGWIELLYKRWSAGHALHTAYLLNTMNELIAEHADAPGADRAELRRVALGQLASDDAKTVALSLVFLGVVGQTKDLPNVERFVGHPADLVNRAARACRFELQQAERR